MLDRMEERLSIGRATKAFNDALRNLRRLHSEPDELQGDGWIDLSRKVDLAKGTLLRLQGATPGLLLSDYAFGARNVGFDERLVICCSLTGLAIFEGDEVIGEPEVGWVILKGAVEGLLPGDYPGPNLDDIQVAGVSSF